MALSKDDIQACASRLHQAEKTRVQIRQLSQDFPDITIADAYAIQKAWVEMKVAQGRVVKGHKIGLTSSIDFLRAMLNPQQRYFALQHALIQFAGIHLTC